MDNNTIVYRLINEDWIEATYGEVALGEDYRIEAGSSGGFVQKSKQEDVIVVETPIRIITTGSMQTRFSISEEVAINSGNDEVAKVLLSRLLNAKNINLDLEELTSGIAHIVNYLHSINALHLNASPSDRIDQLLVDGTADEEYK